MACVRCGTELERVLVFHTFSDNLCFFCVLDELHALRKLKEDHWGEHKLRPIPDDGIHITVEQFLFMSSTGFLDSHDGSGFMATKLRMSDMPAIPGSDVVGAFSHVVWFHNKVKVSKKTSKEILDNTSNVETLNKDSIN